MTELQVEGNPITEFNPAVEDPVERLTDQVRFVVFHVADLFRYSESDCSAPPQPSDSAVILAVEKAGEYEAAGTGPLGPERKSKRESCRGQSGLYVCGSEIDRLPGGERQRLSLMMFAIPFVFGPHIRANARSSPLVDALSFQLWTIVRSATCCGGSSSAPAMAGTEASG